MSSAARTRTDPRISRRRRAVARTKRRRSVASGAAVALVAVGLWVAFWSPLLAVEHVVVVGARHVSSADVARVADLDPEDNLLLVSTARVQESVETLPWVAEAKVNRRLPGTVRVKVTERKARMVLLVDNERWLLDAAGNVLAPAYSAGEELPVLAGARVHSVGEGHRIQDVEVRAALSAWGSLSARIRQRVVGVLAPTSERITLSLDDGTQIRFGAAESLRAKNEVLQALLAQMKTDGVSAAYIDVRVPTSPAISNAPPAPAATATPAPHDT